MDNINFSNKLLAKIQASAIKYACRTSDVKHCSDSIINRIETMLGYVCKKDEINNCDQLDVIITLLSSCITGEQKKSQNNLASYSYSRHIELHKLQDELKEKRSVLSTHCALFANAKN